MASRLNTGKYYGFTIHLIDQEYPHDQHHHKKSKKGHGRDKHQHDKHKD